MRSLGGFVLLAGIGVGLFVYLPTPVDRHASLENVQRLWTKSDRLNSPALAPAVSRSFSPNLSLAKLTPPEPRRAKRSESSTARGARAVVTAPAPMLAVHRTGVGWQPVVSATAVAITSGSGAASLKPKDSTSRYKLVVEIQRKLKKRGCYWGRIDGSWGAGSKYAMQEFIDRINATLPIEQPDYVLLTLLQANGDKSCGACPSGHTATVGGSCVPQTITAEVLPWQQAGTPQAAGQPLLRPVGTTIVTTYGNRWSQTIAAAFDRGRLWAPQRRRRNLRRLRSRQRIAAGHHASPRGTSGIRRSPAQGQAPLKTALSQSAVGPAPQSHAEPRRPVLTHFPC
jgi:hypothetical protein